jgi:pimeloyl-ACP methyl ester carboxylesterase
VAMKIPEFANESWAYVPRSGQDDVPLGIVVWLHGPGGFDWKELLALWRPLCDRHDLILIAPKAAAPAKWTPGELGLVERLLGQVIEKYDVDPARVVVCGQDSGGALAFAAAFRDREIIRAVAAVDAVPAGQTPENEPPYRLAVYSASAHNSRLARSIETSVAAMRKMKVPVTTKNLGEATRALTTDELAELARWIDMLDRI